ncbi:MAG: guanylate kinase [Desulfobulbaceae bacterium]|nr:guanylate kinase [Desulfobulbaceae bacterium]
MAEGRLYIVSAPSGTGKTTILKKLMAELPALTFSVSHTTRAPRENESDGRDYHFVKKAEFSRMREGGEFLESAEVHGNLYGTALGAVIGQLDAGTDVILDIDVQGAAQVKKSKKIEPVTIFIVPPSMSELERRLSGRGTDSSETIRLRLDNAATEMAGMENYDHVIVNDELGEALEMVKAVILAQRSRAGRTRNGSPIPALSTTA